MADCEVWGIELSKYAREYARDRLNLNVSKSDLGSNMFGSGFFDIVFLVGTVEHLISPKKMLVSINRILKPGGLLVITTINTGGVLPIYSIKPPEHLFYFNYENMLVLLDKTGYQCVLKKTYFVSYRLDDLFHRFSEFCSFNVLKMIEKRLNKYIPSFSMKIPTNEMLVIGRKPI